MTTTSPQWFMRRKSALLDRDCYELRDAALPDLADGQVATRTMFISLDPYLAKSMQTWEGPDPRWSSGEIMGRTVFEITESRDSRYKPGDVAWGVGRWRGNDVFDADALKAVPKGANPPSLALGALGASGLTAWIGLDLGGLKPGQTLFVSAATGPVGSMAGQLAKMRGCRVIGQAGGPEKCAYAVDTLGFDACIDHRTPDNAGQLAAAAPEGVDLVFENIGQPSLDPALANMKFGGVIMLCGLAAHYNSDQPMVLRNYREFLYRRLTFQGFITAEHEHLYPQALEEMSAGIASGQIKVEETLIDGLENAADAYLAMLRGEGFGKRLIRL